MRTYTGRGSRPNRGRFKLLQLLLTLFGLGTLAVCSKQEETPAPPKEPSQVMAGADLEQQFLIQAAAFASEKNAQRLVSELAASNFSAFYTADSARIGESLFRVRVGPFHQESVAATALRRMQESGFREAYLIKELLPRNEPSKPRADVLPSRAMADEVVVRKITTIGDCSHPLWSPNGREIAFFRTGQDAQGIYTIGSGGGHISRIIVSSDKREVTSEFTWSPTGNRLAVVVREIDRQWDSREALWIVEKDGRKLAQLLELEHSWQVLNNLRWSPNDDYLAVSMTGRETELSSQAVAQIRVIALTGTTTHGHHEEIEIEVPYSTSEMFVGNWQNGRALVYLTGDRWEDKVSTGKTYRLWGFDVPSRKSQLLWSKFETSPIRGFELDQSKEYALLGKGTEISLLDLYSLKEAGSIPADPVADISSFKMSATREIYLVVGGKLCKADLNGNTVDLGTEVDGGFTLSPSGDKACFIQDGNLVTTRLRR